MPAPLFGVMISHWHECYFGRLLHARADIMTVHAARGEDTIRIAALANTGDWAARFRRIWRAHDIEYMSSEKLPPSATGGKTESRGFNAQAAPYFASALMPLMISMTPKPFRGIHLICREY